jgi:hypothetical protein
MLVAVVVVFTITLILVQVGQEAAGMEAAGHHLELAHKMERQTQAAAVVVLVSLVQVLVVLALSLFVTQIHLRQLRLQQALQP